MFNHMVEHRVDTLDATFAALTHPARREMLTRLSRHDMRVTELAAYFNMSLAAASKHIRKLEKVGLVSRRVSGRDHTIMINAQPLAGAADWLAQFGTFRLRPPEQP